VTNIVGTTATLGGLVVSTGMLSAQLISASSLAVSGMVSGSTLVGTSVTSGGLFATNVTGTNVVGTNISSATLNLSTGLTTGMLLATTSISTGTIESNLGGFNTINSTTISSSNVYLSQNLFVGGTLTTVNITSTNVLQTNITATSLIISNGSLNATFNANTIGPIVTSNGNVGIGATVGNSRLTIVASTPPSTNESGVSGIQILSSNGITTASLYLGADGTGDVTWIQSTKNGAFVPLSLLPRGGNVGIGTTSPGAKLDVSGTLRATTSVTSGGLFATNSTVTNIVGTNVTLGGLVVNNAMWLNTTGSTISEDVSLASSIGTGSIINSLSTITLAVAGSGTGNNTGFLPPNSGKYILFSGTGTRYIQTKALNLTNAVYINLYAIVGNDSNGGEGPESGEDIAVQYSSDGINYTSAGIIILSTGSASWTTFTLVLPAGAKGSNIFLRIIQVANSGGGNDQYGIQSISIINSGFYGTDISINGNITSGRCLITNTTNATGVGTGGSLTVLGGVSISKDIFVGGTLTSSSDIRLKENIVNIKDVNEKMLDKIDNIRGVKFNYKYSNSEDKHIGFIAQDFVEYFPELLRRPDIDGYYTLDYQKVNVILLECIKELREEIRELRENLV